MDCSPERKDRNTKALSYWNELRFYVDESVQPYLVGTMTDISSIHTESVDGVFLSHNIEHLYPQEIPVLSEFLRVLKPDGFAVVTCPDLQAVCALVAEDKLKEPDCPSLAGPIAPLDILYGRRPEMARGNLYMAHRFRFIQNVLTEALQAIDYKFIASMSQGHPYFDLWGVTSKEAPPEDLIKDSATEHMTPL